MNKGRTIQATVKPLTVVELAREYVRFAKTYYVKNGKQTDQVGCIKNAIRPLVALYGRTAAADFGPLALQVVVTKMIELDWSCSYCNDAAAILKRIWKMGRGAEGSAVNYQGLRAVDGLRRGRSSARRKPSRLNPSTIP